MFFRRLRGESQTDGATPADDSDEVTEECWENQRFIPFQRSNDGSSGASNGGGSGGGSVHNMHSWGPSGESAFGRPHWSNKKGDTIVCRESFLLPAGWSWVTGWDVAPHKDSLEGWYYAPDFSVSTRFCTTKPNKLSLVRRRKWVRVRKNCTAELERVSSVRGKGNSSLADPKQQTGSSSPPMRIDLATSPTGSTLSPTTQVFVPQFCFRFTTWTTTAFYGFPITVSTNAYGGLLHTISNSNKRSSKAPPTLAELAARLRAREQERVHMSFSVLHPLLASANFFDSSRTAAAIAAANATAYEDAEVEEGMLGKDGTVVFKKTTGGINNKPTSESNPGQHQPTSTRHRSDSTSSWESQLVVEDSPAVHTSRTPTSPQIQGANATDGSCGFEGGDESLEHEDSAFTRGPSQASIGTASSSPTNDRQFSLPGRAANAGDGTQEGLSASPTQQPLPSPSSSPQAAPPLLPSGLQPLNENQYAKVIKRKKLATRVDIRTLGYVHRFGIAPMLRRHLWVSWSGAAARKAAHSTLFKELAEAGVRLMEIGHRNGPNEMLGEIMVDVVRTAPRHPFFEHSQVVGLLRPAQQRGSAGSISSSPSVGSQLGIGAASVGGTENAIPTPSSPSNRTISSAIASNSIGVRTGGFINDDSGSYRLTLTLVCLALYEREQSAQYAATKGFDNRSLSTISTPTQKATPTTTGAATSNSFATLVPRDEEQAPVLDNRFVGLSTGPLVRSRTNSDFCAANPASSSDSPPPILANLVNGGSRVPEYHQAFSYLAAVLLLNMPEEEAFWTMVCILENYLPHGYYDDFEMHTDLRVLVELVQDELPDLDAVFQERQVDISVFASGWLQGLFCAHFPFPTAARILDVMFAEGNSSILVRFIFSFLQVYKRELIEMDGSCSVGQFANQWAREAYDVEGVLAGAMQSTSRLRLMTVVEDRRFELRRQRVKGDMAATQLQ